jgi:hypothetical protein
MDSRGVSPLVAALVTALALTVPLPIRWVVVDIDPLVGLFVIPTILTVVVALLVWRYGWARQAEWGALLGVVAVAVLTQVSEVLDRHGGAPALSFAGSLLIVMVVTLVVWEIGGAFGRRLRSGLRPRRPQHLEVAETP